MRMPRGLFGSAAREAAKERQALASAASAENPNPEKSFLGGLIKYQRPVGMDGVSNLSRAGAALSDVGAAFGAGQGGNVAALQRDALASQAARQAAELKKSFEATIKDPQELALYRAAPDAYLKAAAERYKPQTLSGGQTLVNGPNGDFTAPKLVDDGGIYGTQTDKGYTTTGARGPSIAETETERAHRVGEQIDRIRAAVAQGQLTVQQGQLALDRAKHDARKAAGGYGTAGVGQVLGPTLDADWEMQ